MAGWRELPRVEHWVQRSVDLMDRQKVDSWAATKENQKVDLKDLLSVEHWADQTAEWLDSKWAEHWAAWKGIQTAEH